VGALARQSFAVEEDTLQCPRGPPYEECHRGAHLYMYMYEYMGINKCVYEYMYMYVYVYVWVYVNV
jgi:hypothetical protein